MKPHAWDCACGVRNALQFHYCRNCRRAFDASGARWVYPSAPIAPSRPLLPPAAPPPATPATPPPVSIPNLPGPSEPPTPPPTDHAPPSAAETVPVPSPSPRIPVAPDTSAAPTLKRVGGSRRGARGWIWVLPGIALLAGLGWMLLPRPSLQQSSQEVNASARFQLKLKHAMATVGGGDTFRFEGQPAAHIVHLAVTNEWYSFSPRGKEVLTTRLGGVWKTARKEAGITSGPAVLRVFDSSHRKVSEWSSASGTRVVR